MASYIPIKGPTGRTYPGYTISDAQIEQMIIRESSARFISPNVAIRIFRAEGLGSYQSSVPRSGGGSYLGREASFGPYQMFLGGGVGNRYERQTGRQLITDNSAAGILNQIRYALDVAAKESWQAWAGRGPARVDNWDGLRNARALNNWSGGSGIEEPGRAPSYAAGYDPRIYAGGSAIGPGAAVEDTVSGDPARGNWLKRILYTVGFRDPGGTYPIDQYKGEPSTTEPARGEGEQSQTPAASGEHGSYSGSTGDFGEGGYVSRDGAGGSFVTQPTPGALGGIVSGAKKFIKNSVYPYNKATQSMNPVPEERHIFELDDTPGNEAVRLRDKFGTGFSTNAEGDMKYDVYGMLEQTVEEGYTLKVGGGTHIHLNGTKLVIDGPLEIIVKGDMKTTVEGNKTDIVKGRYQLEVQGTEEKTVVGHSSNVYGNDHTGVYLGNTNAYTKGHSSIFANKDINVFSGRNVRLSAGIVDNDDTENGHITIAAHKSVTTSAGSNITDFSKSINQYSYEDHTIKTSVFEINADSSEFNSTNYMLINAEKMDTFVVDSCTINSTYLEENALIRLDMNAQKGDWNLTDGSIGGVGGSTGVHVYAKSANLENDFKLGGALIIDSDLHVGGQIIANGDITAFGGIAIDTSYTSSPAPTETHVDSALIPPGLDITEANNTLGDKADVIDGLDSDFNYLFVKTNAGVRNVDIDGDDAIISEVNMLTKNKIGANN